jgi:AcrR family transcriptional regulator
MRKPGSNGTETLRKLRLAAIRLLSERGYQGMNLRMLASDLGMQAGSLYNYIDSKQALLFWLLKEATEKLLSGFGDSVAGIQDAEEQIRQFVAFHLEYHVVNRKQSAVLSTEMRSLTPRNYRAISQLQRLYTDKVRDIIDRGLKTGKFKVEDSRIAAFALVQMLTGVTRWYRSQGRLKTHELIAVYTELTLGMLKAGRPVASARARKARSGAHVHGDRPQAETAAVA